MLYLTTALVMFGLVVFLVARAVRQRRRSSDLCQPPGPNEAELPDYAQRMLNDARSTVRQAKEIQKAEARIKALDVAIQKYCFLLVSFAQSIPPDAYEEAAELSRQIGDLMLGTEAQDHLRALSFLADAVAQIAEVPGREHTCLEYVWHFIGHLVKIRDMNFVAAGYDKCAGALWQAAQHPGMDTGTRRSLCANAGNWAHNASRQYEELSKHTDSARCQVLAGDALHALANLETEPAIIRDSYRRCVESYHKSKRQYRGAGNDRSAYDSAEKAEKAELDWLLASKQYGRHRARVWRRRLLLLPQDTMTVLGASLVTIFGSALFYIVADIEGASMLRHIRPLQLIYLSAITFATLSFGDFRPADTLARCVASAEALIGTILIACFVASLASRRMRDLW